MVEKSPTYTSQATLGKPTFTTFPYKMWQTVYMRKKDCSTRRVNHLARSPFFEGRVTLQAGPPFFHINALTRQAWSTQSRQDNESMHKCCFDQETKWWLVLDSEQGGPSSPGQQLFSL